MFRKLLVANRGEIALRVLRACREMGIATAAVYSEADRWAHYVSQADEAHLLGPPPARESYLRIDRIIEIAKKARADAIHPGYGFLAENADFSKACGDAGIRFVGPPPDAIRRAGNKIEARKMAEANGIPVVPGLSRAVTESEAADFARRHRFPILLKAAGGGGGRGMRVVRDAPELPRALREASSEAQSAFGDPTVFVEKYVEKPRHVEIQILADGRGAVVHLGERECSIQRRHQKLVEESPSVAVDDALRERMGETAKKIAKLVGYRNAGTCEFLLDAKGNFFFLEVNTRLQVEHPVTEMVTGIDLVKQQIAIAAGERLPWKQEEIRPRGHAIEARICAEDPFHGFAPSIGEIAGVRCPAGPFVRVDTDLVPRSRVSVYYDSMIAKLIAWAPDRAQAIERMVRALREFKVVGVRTTVPFHLQLFQDRRFRAGRIHTRFLETEFEPRPPGGALDAAVLAAALEFRRRESATPRYASPRPLSAWKRELR
ncbi:MAG: acetyl-CoA carboxylase biotin carboxylase subunit [Planctomycetes bacterium]|nr:acetyl-CoA carboxylase biotin carboxylase subunit [Planctomycetota bacterium]